MYFLLWSLSSLPIFLFTYTCAFPSFPMCQTFARSWLYVRRRDGRPAVLAKTPIEGMWRALQLLTQPFLSRPPNPSTHLPRPLRLTSAEVNGNNRINVKNVEYSLYLPGRICFFSGGDGLTGTPLTTSARISALNIVGELLRKVGVRDFTFTSIPSQYVKWIQGTFKYSWNHVIIMSSLFMPVNGSESPQTHTTLFTAGRPLFSGCTVSLLIKGCRRDSATELYLTCPMNHKMLTTYTWLTNQLESVSCKWTNISLDTDSLLRL